MATLATAWVDIVPNLKGVTGSITKELQGVNVKGVGARIGSDIADETGSEIGKSSGKIGSSFAGIAKAATGVIAGISFANIVQGATEASDATDKFRSTLEFSGLDTSAIDRLTKSTQEYADKTVYDLADIQNVTAQLASNGVAGFDTLAEAAGNLNAVAGGNAETFKSVGMVLTQTAGQGKLTTENFNQLSDAIPGASGALQEAMQQAGAFEGNFRDAMANGEISADEFFAAVQKLGMQDVAKEAATSTSTIEGALGNLEATVTGAVAGVINTLKPYATRAIDTVSQFIGTAGQQVQTFIDTVAQSGAIQSLMDAFTQFGTAVWAIVQPFAQIIGNLTGFSTAANPASVVAQAFATVVQTLAGGLQQAATWIQQNLTWLTPLAAAIGAVTLALGASTIALGAYNAITNTVRTATALFNAVLNANPLMLIVTAILAVVAALVTFFTQTETGRQLWQQFTDFLGTTVENVKQWFGDAAQWISDKWNALVGWMQSVPGSIKGFFADIGQWFSNKFNEVKTGIETKFNEAVDWVKGIPGRITGALGDLGNLLWNAGASIINGLLNGLKSAWSNVTGFVSGIADWIAEHKGPLSYDRRLLIPAGEAIMSGFNRGLTSRFSDIKKTIGDINALASSGFDAPTELAVNIRSANATAYARPDVAAYDTGSAALSKEDLVDAMLEAIRRMPNLQVWLDGNVMAGELAPALDRQFGNRYVRGL